MAYFYRPTKAEILAAAGKSVPDVIAPDLKVLFCGINPGLYTAAIGHHFGRPGNRFWPALYAAGFTDRLLLPFEEYQLLKHGYGITNLVSRATATVAELNREELLEGRRVVDAKVRQCHPEFLAVLGIETYRKAFESPKAQLGRQPKPIHDTMVWVLPNPSGLNAHYRPGDFARLFLELRLAAEKIPS